MNRKSTKSQGMGVDNMTAEQAVIASTGLQITKEIENPRPKNVRYNPRTLGQEFIGDLFTDVEDEQEDMGRRVYEVNGKQYRLRQVNPWAMWEVVGDGGIPNELKGRFTDLKALENALSAWQARDSHKGVIARKHKEKLGPNFDNRASKEETE